MLTLQADVDVPHVMPHGQAVGIDLGLKSFLATSTGEQIARPRFFVDFQGKLKLLQQRASRKKLGSNNWQKAQAKVARLHEHIRDTRKDFHFKLAHKLCDEAGMIFAEDLNFKAWAKGMFSKHTRLLRVWRVSLNQEVDMLEAESLFCQGESGWNQSNLPELQLSYGQERVKPTDSSVRRMWI